MDSTAYDLAKRLVAAGISPVPIRTDGSKRSTVQWKRLQSEPLTDTELKQNFAGLKIGIAAMGGSVSGNLECFDVDDPEVTEDLLAAIEKVLPGVLETLTRNSTPKGGIHLWYRVNGEVAGNTKLAELEDGSTRIETRAQGGYALLPGSPSHCHPTGNLYKHESGPTIFEPTTISAEQRDVIHAIARSFDQRAKRDNGKVQTQTPTMLKVTETTFHAGDGGRPGDIYNEQCTSFAPILEPHGWELDHEDDGEEYWRRPGKDEPGHSAVAGAYNGKWVLRVFSTNAHPLDGSGSPTSYTPFKVYSILNHGGDDHAAAQALGRKQLQANVLPPREPEHKPYVTFPTTTLPSVVAVYIETVARAMDCDPAFIGAPLLTNFAAAIGNSRRLEVKQGWLVPPVIWMATVGYSGTAKSPAHNEVHRILRTIDTERHGIWKDEMELFEIEMKRYDAAMKVWEKKNIMSVPPDKPEKPKHGQVLVNDTTVAALAVALEDNPRGLLLERDELSGWWASFNRFGSGGDDEQQFLSMYDASRIKVNRKTGDSPVIIIENAAVSISGGIQPNVLKDVITPQRLGSGMAARFLYTFPPTKWPDGITSQVVTENDRASITVVIRALFALGFEDDCQPVIVRLHPESLSLLDQFCRALPKDMDDARISAVQKFRGAAARLALVLHCVRWACDEGAGDDPLLVQPETMQAATKLANWFRGETERVYDLLSETLEQEHHRKLIEWIAARIAKTGNGLTERDLYTYRREISGQQQAESVLNRLVDAGLGRWEQTPRTRYFWLT